MIFFKWLRAVSLKFLLLILCITCLLIFILGTHTGLRLVVDITQKYLPGELNITSLEGNLWQHITFEELTYIDQEQRLSLKKAKLKWQLKSLYPLHIRLETLALDELLLTHEKRELVLNARFKTEGDIISGLITLGENKAIIKGTFNGPWTIHADIPKPEVIDPALSQLKSTLTIDATIIDNKHATLDAYLSKGQYLLPKGSSIKAIEFKKADVHAKLTPDGLSLEGLSALDENITANAKVKIPKVKLNRPPTKDSSLKGKITLLVQNLKFFDTPSQREALGELGLLFDKADGKLKADLSLDGTLSSPKVKGDIKLTEGKMTLPDLGLTLNPVRINLITDGEKWQLNADITPNKGQALTISGSGRVTPELDGEVLIQGESVKVMDTAEYRVEVTPNITLSKKPTGIYIDGSILVPKARLDPTSFAHTVRLTQDAVFIDDDTNPNPLNLNVNIAVDMGDDVKVDIKGLQGHVDGLLHIKQAPKQPLKAVGSLTLLDGYYEAYGQKLHIEEGKLTFLGQQIDNPNVHIRATRHFDRDNAEITGSNELFDFSEANLDNSNLSDHTTVGILVTGKLDSPKVKLFSNPPNLSQADILSMLLLGRPADQAGKARGQLLIQAMRALHLDSGSKGVKMMQDLQKSLGIDFNVENKSMGTESSDWTKTSVSVGKSITKRVYLRYNVGLFQENSSVFTLTYLLNKFLSIKVTASDIGSGIDVTYSHSD